MTQTFSTTVGRWSRLGPYYAMFPVDFAFDIVAKHSRQGQALLDPFAGRASSVYAAAAQGRSACGIEINPVGWLYGQIKLRPAPEADVIARVQQLAEAAAGILPDCLHALPPFFSSCFSPSILRYLLAARDVLRWRTDHIDATVMAFILVYLHGKMPDALSNQMRQGKAMSPEYSIRWWRDRALTPPDIDPVRFLSQRITWRYGKGAPDFSNAEVRLGDSILILPEIAGEIASGQRKPFDLLFTSPPYYSVTHYHNDQWLRLWMLGGIEHPAAMQGAWQGRFESRPAYRILLQTVFRSCAAVMSRKATIYVRTDARAFTFETTMECLRDAFPKRTFSTEKQPFRKQTQTALFGDKSEKPGEIDVLSLA